MRKDLRLRLIFRSLIVSVLALALGLSGLSLIASGSIAAPMYGASETHHDGDCAEHGPGHAISQAGHCCATASAGIIVANFAVVLHFPVRQATIGIVSGILMPAPLFGIFRPPRMV
jgi:hypothetical protein